MGELRGTVSYLYWSERRVEGILTERLKERHVALAALRTAKQQRSQIAQIGRHRLHRQRGI